MSKKPYAKIEEFDKAFDQGDVEVDFSKATPEYGMDKMKKIAPFEIPDWVANRIDQIAKKQGNSRNAVIGQLLAKAVGE